MEKFGTVELSYHEHDLSCHDSCHEEEQQQLNKSDWWYLVNQLEQWRVMNLCKDPNVRVKGAYFTTCFRRECFKAELKANLA